MTKKGKLILGWSIPALTVAVAAGVALPTIIFLDSEKREILNSSTNTEPSSFIAFTETEQKEFEKDYNSFISNLLKLSMTLLGILATMIVVSILSIILWFGFFLYLKIKKS